VFLGRSVTQHKQVSDVTAHAIDEEVRRVIETNYMRAKELLTTHLQHLHAMAEALMKYETIDEGQLKEIMADKPPTPPPGWEEPLGGNPPNKGGSGPTDGRPAFGSPASQH
jgi:cell division protease FtsH